MAGPKGPTTIPIRSLKDGVGRQAPSKRLPTEAQDLDNVLVTLENSAEKRPGNEVIPARDSSGDLTTYGNLLLPDSTELFHYWFDLTPEEVYLITVDYSGTGDVFFAHKLDHSSGELRFVTSGGGADEAAYVRYGNGTYSAAEALRVIALGPNLLILNTKVSAGFSSWQDGKTFGMDGIVTTTNDVTGAPEEYLSASVTDPQNKATIWVEGRAYAAGSEVYNLSEGLGGVIEVAKADIASSDNTLANFHLNTFWTNSGRTLDRVPVKEFKYPDASKAYLGQSLSSIEELPLPPEADDAKAANGAEAMLAALYPDKLGVGTGSGTPGNQRTTAGTGKIYYFENGYGGVEPGYYIVRATDKSDGGAYLMPVRTPDAGSLLDSTRLPVTVRPTDNGTTWTMEFGDYTPRTSGDLEVNPGPTVFQEGRQAPISCMALFRNRLWFGADDAVFSSETDDFGDFFLKDPALIVDTDPIDVLLSSNKYTPVSTLTPFESYMFINTEADTQFSLQGSENQITPYTAEVSSASFYSTAPLTQPILTGPQLYFFDRSQMYIFFNNRQVSIQKSVEVSQHCPNYLPTQYGAIATMPAYDSILMTDDLDKKTVYLYTNRYRGDQVAQNAFFKYTFTDEVHSFYPHRDSLYHVAKRNGKYYLKKSVFPQSDPTVAFLDDVFRLVSSGSNTTYDVLTNTTTFDFTGTAPWDNDVVRVSSNDKTRPDWGTELTVITVDTDSTPGTTSVQVKGRYDDDGLELVFGKNFTMAIELSPIYARDQQNNVVDGVLSLRTMHTRHANTGAYRVERTVRGRTTSSTDYSPMELDQTLGLDDLAMSSFESTGQVVSKIFGYASETSIKILSDTPNPVNITQIELKGIFRPTSSSFVR